jgi:hypothetical protein
MKETLSLSLTHRFHQQTHIIIIITTIVIIDPSTRFLSTKKVWWQSFINSNLLKHAGTKINKTGTLPWHQPESQQRRDPEIRLKG